jgi:hypothetical protein
MNEPHLAAAASCRHRLAADARIHCVNGDGGGRPEEPDPEAFAGLRWEPAQHGSGSGFPGGGRDWLTGSPSARRVARCLAAADTVGVVVAVTLIAASLVRGRPTDGAGVLVDPAILLLAAGQVWAMLVIWARQPPEYPALPDRPGQVNRPGPGRVLRSA